MDGAPRDRDAGPDLTERTLEEGTVFSGGFLEVRRDRVRLPDGREAYREYIVHPGAVAIVAIDAEGRIVIERQHRYPLRRDMLEIPAGKCEHGEDTLETARRELEEETGYRAANWERLGMIHNAIAYSDEFIEVFLATGLTRCKSRLDEGEFLEVLHFDAGEVFALVDAGRITDAKTISALFFARDRLRR